MSKRKAQAPDQAQVEKVRTVADQIVSDAKDEAVKETASTPIQEIMSTQEISIPLERLSEKAYAPIHVETKLTRREGQNLWRLTSALERMGATVPKRGSSGETTVRSKALAIRWFLNAIDPGDT